MVRGVMSAEHQMNHSTRGEIWTHRSGVRGGDLTMVVETLDWAGAYICSLRRLHKPSLRLFSLSLFPLSVSLPCSALKGFGKASSFSCSQFGVLPLIDCCMCLKLLNMIYLFGFESFDFFLSDVLCPYVRCMLINLGCIYSYWNSR